MVNGSHVDPTYIVQHDDLIIHHIHRHEPVVTSKPIVMIDYQDDFMVIDKPGGIPVCMNGSCLIVYYLLIDLLLHTRLIQEVAIDIIQ